MTRTALVEARLKKHWSQEEAAEVIGIDHNTLYRWEAGKATPRGYNLRKLCEVYEMSAAELGFDQKRQADSSGKEVEVVPLPLLEVPPEQSGDTTNPGTWVVRSAASLGPLLDEQWSSDTIIEALQTILPVVKAIPMMTRRDFLQVGIATAMTASLPLTIKKHITEEERVQLCNAFHESIDAGWKLFTLARNAQVLAASQAQLILLQQAHSTLPTHKRSALYSSIYNLMGMALCHQEHYSDALKAHANAYIAALGDGNAQDITYSLLCQANSHYARGQYSTAIEAVNQAIRTLGALDEQQHIHTKAHLLGIWADSAMMAGDYAIAHQKLDAISTLLNDISPNEEFDQSSWYQLTGKYAYLTRDYSSAAQWYEQAVRELPEDAVLRRGLVLMSLISTYTTIQDLDASLITIEKAIPVIRTLNSPIINRPFIQALQGLLIVFPYEIRVKTAVSGLLQQIRR